MGLGEGEGEMMMGLDLKLCTLKSVNGFLKEAAVEGGEGKATKMEEFVKLLEEEKAKIEVFKRELPLCMHLIGDGANFISRQNFAFPDSKEMIICVSFVVFGLLVIV